MEAENRTHTYYTCACIWAEAQESSTISEAFWILWVGVGVVVVVYVYVDAVSHQRWLAPNRCFVWLYGSAWVWVSVYVCMYASQPTSHEQASRPALLALYWFIGHSWFTVHILGASSQLCNCANFHMNWGCMECKLLIHIQTQTADWCCE